LIASVLLIAFTVSVAMIVMGWFSSFVRTTTENVSGVTQGAIGCSSGIVDIDRIYITNTTGNATVIVKNTGQIALTVNAMIVAVNGTVCKTSTGVSISAGSSGTLNMSGCVNITNAVNFSSALITTSCAGITDSTTKSSDVTFI
jgi:hypothetical protein